MTTAIHESAIVMSAMSKPASKPTLSRRDQRRARRQARAEAPAVLVPEAALEVDAAPDDGDEPVESDAKGESPIYTIDELAALTTIPSRTIRFYQSSGVLPKPDRRGRIAYYGSSHIERLELIGKLQDRGLRMRAIKELVERIDSGEIGLQEWLGVEAQLSSAWVDDAPKLLGRTELDALLGERRPGFIAELGRAGILELRPDETYLVPSPGLLRAVMRLEDAGVSVELAAGASAILQRHLGKAARELASYFGEHAVVDALGELRAVGLETVRLIFAREMEQVLRKMVESGEASRLDKKKRRRR
jgi:DNA-binding transcriptional MerR regulator